MSRYRDGMRRLSQKPEKTMIGSGLRIPTPGYILGEVRRLNVEFDSFNQDIINSLKKSWKVWISSLPPEEIQTMRDKFGPAWDPYDDAFGVLKFLDESPIFPLYKFYSGIWYTAWRGWKDFYDEHNEWQENMWGSTLDAVEAWRRNLVGMREAAKKFEVLEGLEETGAGMNIESPEPEKGDPMDLPGGGLVDLLKKLLIGGLVIVGGVLGITALNARSGGGSSLPRLPPASASERSPRTKKEAQAERVAERIKEKS